MFVKLFYLFAAMHCAFSQSVRLTEGGNVAVGFGGYEAEAGLGGLLRGDLSAGGLHASARTPNGQAAAAGLGGSTGANGASGGLYAGATAGNGVGATAALGGDTNSGVGYGGAEAHAGGVAKEVTAVKTAGVGVVNSPAPVDVGTSVDSSSSDDSDSSDDSSSSGGSSATVVDSGENAVAVEQVIAPVPAVVTVQKAYQPVVYQIQKRIQPVQVQKIAYVASPPVQVRKIAYVPAPQIQLQKIAYVPPPPPPVNYVIRKQIVVPQVQKTYHYHKVYQPSAVVAPVGKIQEIPEPPVIFKQEEIPVDKRPVLWQRTYSYQAQRIPVTPAEEVATRIDDDAEAPEDSSNGDSSSSVDSATPAPGFGTKTYIVDYTGYKTALWNDLFNIPINTLRAVNTFLSNKANGQYNFQKTIKVI